MKTNIINRLRQLTVLLAAASLTGCGWVKDDLEPCPAKLSLKFVYDYNMKFADAFHHEVRSVNVWAFDSSTGALVWKGAATDAQLPTEPGFVMETPLEGGSYDFVAWCGLSDESPMKLATYNPASKEELEVTLATEQSGTMLVSDAEIPGLFHGMKSYTYTPDKFKPSIEQVTIPLMKDTNAIRVLLQNLDGTEMKQEDFTVTITDANSELGWNNAVLQGPTVTYMPWEIRYGGLGREHAEHTGGRTRRRHAREHHHRVHAHERVLALAPHRRAEVYAHRAPQQRRHRHYPHPPHRLPAAHQGSLRLDDRPAVSRPPGRLFDSLLYRRQQQLVYGRRYLYQLVGRCSPAE